MTGVRLFVLAGVLALVLTPLVRRIAHRAGALDAPGGRKIHSASVPRLGGVAVVLAVALALALESVLGGGGPHVAAWRPVATGGALIVALGVWDDLRPVPPVVKVAVQTAAASVAIALGVLIGGVTVLGRSFETGPLAIPLTVLWIVGLTNAFNLMDGLDGLATGLAIIAAATCATVAVARDDVAGGMLLLALLGALCGFLPHNFNPATIFLGDSGSLVVGYVLAVTAITGWQKGATALAVAVPLLIFALPIAETLLSMGRRARLLGLRHVFSADREHMHHRLLALGLSQRTAVLLLYGVSLSLSLLALVTMRLP
ncbi:MAG TPA: MraY family glycosyltransferase [Methylomirabilota bacterium]|nr:MraY family glycosyltransferase [Methylomirabilota bacterium]